MVEKEWLTIENIEGLSMLEPYGMQNAEPVFCMKDLIVEDITPLSSDRHVRLSLSKDGTRLGAIWFGTGAGGLGFVPGSTVDAAFHLEINEYHNRRSVQLVICDVQLSECEHRADQLILNLYNILMQDGCFPSARILSPSGGISSAARRTDGSPCPTGRSRAAFPGRADARSTSASSSSRSTSFPSPASSATISKRA